MSEDMRKYLGWGAVGGGVITAGVGLQRKSVPASIAGISLAAVGALLLTREVVAEEPEEAEVAAFAVTAG